MTIHRKHPQLPGRLARHLGGRARAPLLDVERLEHGQRRRARRVEHPQVAEHAAEGLRLDHLQQLSMGLLVPLLPSVSDTLTSPPPEKISTTPRNSGREISPSTEPHTHTTKTAQSPNQTTGRVPNNAPNPGNAEVPDSAKEEDGAQDMMDVKEPHSQIKLQVSSQTIEQFELTQAIEYSSHQLKV